MVKQLVLALPENRLATLLSQQKFEEAEAFARKFDLDPEVCGWGREGPGHDCILYNVHLPIYYYYVHTYFIKTS